jgi:hypothetical protein
MFESLVLKQLNDFANDHIVFEASSCYYLDVESNQFILRSCINSGVCRLIPFLTEDMTQFVASLFNTMLCFIDLLRKHEDPSKFKLNVFCISEPHRIWIGLAASK